MDYSLDFLFMDTKRSKLDNTITDILKYAKINRGWHIRIICFLYEDNDISNDEIPLYLVRLDREENSLSEMTNLYKEFLNNNGLPDIVVGVGGPDLVYVGKQSLKGSDDTIPVLSWLQDSVINYIQSGRGGYDLLYLASAHLVSFEQIRSELSTFLPNARIITIHNMQFVNQGNENTAFTDFMAKVEACIYGRDYMGFLNGDIYLYEEDKISVVIPMYNAERYISRTLNSIFASKIPCEMLEVIVVDDASPDKSFLVAKSIEEKYPDNLIIVRNDKNRGEGEARNIGLEYASGNLIAFVDADDLIKPEMLQVLYERMKLFECDITGCDYTFSEFENINNQGIEERLYNLTDKRERKRYFFENGWRASVCVHLYKKDMIMNVGLRFPAFRVGADLYFQQLYMLIAERDFECAEPLYIYNQNEGSAIHTYTPEKLRDASDAQEAVYETIASTDLILDIEKEFEVIYYIREFSFYVRQMMLLGLFDENSSDYKDIRERLLKHFPDIHKNPYIIADKSDENMEMYRLLCNNSV